MDQPVGPPMDGRNETPLERCDRNLVELMQEVRVAQTGVQVLFGFLLTVPFTSASTTSRKLTARVFRHVDAGRGGGHTAYRAELPPPAVVPLGGQGAAGDGCQPLRYRWARGGRGHDGGRGLA